MRVDGHKRTMCLGEKREQTGKSFVERADHVGRVDPPTHRTITRLRSGKGWRHELGTVTSGIHGDPEPMSNSENTLGWRGLPETNSEEKRARGSGGIVRTDKGSEPGLVTKKQQDRN